jgi:hypothetical protein
MEYAKQRMSMRSGNARYSATSASWEVASATQTSRSGAAETGTLATQVADHIDHLPRCGDYRLAGGRVKDAWRRRCAAGLCPVLDPAARSRGMAAARERRQERRCLPGS